MFIGNPYVPDAEDRLRGVNTLLNATIHILDGQTNHGEILDYVTAKNIIEDEHKKSLEDTLETFNFTTFANKSYSEHLEKRNRLIIPDEDGTLREFVIFEAAKFLDNEGRKVDVYAHASFQELSKAGVIYPDRYEGTASQHGGRALNNTGWQMGFVEGKGKRTLENEDHSNPFKKIKNIAKEFELELRFRVEHNGRFVTGRYVDMLERIGEWRGLEVTFGRNLESIRRTEKQDIVTALLGLGPEREDGSRIEVLVEDDDALKRWGRQDSNGKLHHLIEVYEIESSREEMTKTEARRYTQTALNKRINTQVEYETTIIDLENVPGLENMKIRFGDTIRIKDEGFNPPFYVEARVFEQTRSIKSQAKKDIKLGDYVEFTEEEVNAIWNMLRREIRKKIDIEKLQEYAEPKKVESDEAPEIKDGENPIWVDTSKTPKVSNVAVGGEWQKMTPTTPEEVNAYNKKQVDDKAEQALKDAKAFSENADNINKGVIDVGAIPLRTSETGARIDWDGVNGLVQYDSEGNEVSWLDLDANAHFANAFLSGRIEALEGYFGKDGTIRITDSGGVEIVRDDGVISSENGMIAGGEPLVPYDPHYMRMGESISGNYNFPVFDNPNGSYWETPYGVGQVDGRGVSDGLDHTYKDVRDTLDAVVFQRYSFVHKARYMVFELNKVKNSGTFAAHIIEGDSANESDRVYYERLEKSSSTKTHIFIVDLGAPSFKEKNFTLKIGWKNSWMGRDEKVIFRMIKTYQTDFIDDL